ncbi:MAG: YegP family protein [Clostridia bacterium]|nr:YegP family protein [Clostridia bacterium]
MGKFVVKNTKTGVKFDLKATNGEVILTSEVYTTERSCMKGVASVQKNAPAAPVEDQTVENVEKQKCPKFEIYLDKAGEIRFRLKATNGQIIGVSEGYKAMKSCVNGIESVKKNVEDAKIERVTE